MYFTEQLLLEFMADYSLFHLPHASSSLKAKKKRLELFEVISSVTSQNFGELYVCLKRKFFCQWFRKMIFRVLSQTALISRVP